MPTKTSKSKTSEGKPNALQKPLQPSKELAAVVGTSPLPRGEVVSKIWEYIRSHNLHGGVAASKSPVDLPLRLDDATASPTTPQGQHQ